MRAANRVVLNQHIVKRLSWENKPRDVDDKEKLVFEPNVNGDIYTVLDASQEASKGFGVRVSQSEKVYFIQRRSGKKVVTTNIGYCTDMTIQQARERASKAALKIKDTGKNPNVIVRSIETRMQDFTVGKILADHLNHCKKREQKPIRDSTVKCRDQTIRWVDSLNWTNRNITYPIKGDRVCFRRGQDSSDRQRAGFPMDYSISQVESLQGMRPSLQ